MKKKSVKREDKPICASFNLPPPHLSAPHMQCSINSLSLSLTSRGSPLLSSPLLSLHDTLPRAQTYRHKMQQVSQPSVYHSHRSSAAVVSSGII